MRKNNIAAGSLFQLTSDPVIMSSECEKAESCAHIPDTDCLVTRTTGQEGARMRGTEIKKIVKNKIFYFK